MRVTVLTKIPSPYQVELFDAIARRRADIELSVLYVTRRDPDRQWADRQLGHAARFLDETPCPAAWVDDADLVVFSWYRNPRVRQLIHRRVAARRAWAFWGERPGFRSDGLPGRLYRRWRLAPLHRDRRVPIWGIGEWAIEGYRREFGGGRLCLNVPYTSDLSRFFALSTQADAPPRTILYSGSLTRRKGVLDLARAFCSLRANGIGASLRILGNGPLEPELRRLLATTTGVEFAGFHDWNEVAGHYAGADLLCAPSLYDGWGLVVAEAMAAGLPVVASEAVGAGRDMVIEGQTGWRVPAGNEALLAEGLRRALGLQASSLAAMRERCRMAARRYDVAAGVARFADAARTSIENFRAAGALSL